MCGIAGKIYFGNQGINKNKELPLIQKTLGKLNHRGPDDNGYFIDRNVWLGSTRLSIIDLSPAGHQPMQNKSGSSTIIFNGEIYNFSELRKRFLSAYKFRSNTDTETLLYLYEKFGTKCLEYIRGMFAFAIWDKKRQEMFIARDRLGKKPIKYYFNSKFFVFASELKAFIDHPGVTKEIDWEAVDEFLTYQYVPSPKTGFKNIWKLPPAHYMIITADGKITLKKYWDLDFVQKLDYSEEEWIEKITDKLKESVRLRLRSDVSLGVHLSGGIDSSLITALASEELSKPVNTFSIGFGEQNYSELEFAKLIADRYHTDHHEVVVKPDVIELLPKLVYQYEEPFADPSILPTWLLMKESKKHFTVALNGDGGDENFAGYRRYKVMKLFNLLKSIPAKDKLSNLLYLLYKYFPNKDISNTSRLLKLFSADNKMFYQDMISFIDTKTKGKLYTQEFKQKIKRSRTKYYLLDKFNAVKNLNLIDQLLYVDINSYLPEVLLAKTDIASMAHSLEVRSPFLDHEFMELTAKMPSSLKLKGLTSKYVLKKIAKKYLPQETFVRRKQGFLPPLDHWFRTALYDYLRSQLLDKKFLQLDLFKVNKLDQLIKDHKNWKANNSYCLWTILTLKHWLDIWFNV